MLISYYCAVIAMTQVRDGHLASEGQTEAEVTYLDTITDHLEETVDGPATASERFEEIYEELKPPYWTPASGDIEGDATEEYRGMMGAILGSGAGAIGATAIAPGVFPASTLVGLAGGMAMGGAAGAASYHAQKAGAAAVAAGAAGRQSIENTLASDQDSEEAFDTGLRYAVPEDQVGEHLEAASGVTMEYGDTTLAVDDESAQRVQDWIDIDGHATVETADQQYGTAVQITVEDQAGDEYTFTGIYGDGADMAD